MLVSPMYFVVSVLISVARDALPQLHAAACQDVVLRSLRVARGRVAACLLGSFIPKWITARVGLEAKIVLSLVSHIQLCSPVSVIFSRAVQTALWDSFGACFSPLADRAPL